MPSIWTAMPSTWTQPEISNSSDRTSRNTNGNLQAVLGASQPLLLPSLALSGVSMNDTARELESRRPNLLRYIQNKVRDQGDAEDILQDVYYQLLRSLDTAVVIEDMTAWLYRAARNRIIDWYRKRKPERMTEVIEAQSFSDVSSSQAVESAGTWDDFVDALADLPPKQRDVFVMHEMEGKSFEEIAEITGEKLNTLLSRKRYAVLALRKKLAQHYADLSA